ncbi:hypothetical protein H632_c4060p0 [Helicosporidium sp. ATCC 50920]|nr:hypothetical protein H632_c4060p0 [Helicosporidium sp. ATCC 50920]|eukprot:KDD71980.1 hypothetical protein H632_c4060p0 [Helicosporidium sp. ATCC 50920]
MSMENLEGASAEERAAAAAEARQNKLRKVISALAALASSSGVAAERGAFMDLVEKEIERLEERLERRGGRMVFSRGVLQAPREQQQARSGRHLGQQRLADHVASILSRVEKELDHADERIGTRLHVIDLDRDGVISLDELQNALSFLKEEVGEEELRAMLQLLSQQAEQGAAGSARTIDVQRLMDLATAEEDKEGGQK